MKISTKGRYALVVMIELAGNSNNEYIPLKDIAERQQISVKYLEKIVAMLNKAGFVQSNRGNNGGYKLVKEPKEYKVGDILRAAEGDLAPTGCVTENCVRKDKCKTFEFWQGLDKAIESYVDSTTLQDLL
jgi:Rrf2 family protein